MNTSKTTYILWAVFVCVLLVLTPHTAWMFRQLEPGDSVWSYVVSYIAAIAFESAIAVLTHKLAKHIEEMPKGKYKTAWDKFAYRYLNAYAFGLFVTTSVSVLANLAHAVQFGHTLTIFTQWGIPPAVYSVAFGGILPVVSLTFARVLSNVVEGEQDEDPALIEAKSKLKEANSTIKQLQDAIRQKENEYSARLTDAENRRIAAEQQSNVERTALEKALNEAEQRLRAFGDVIRFLFGTDLALRDRIRGIRTTWPELSQNGIAQIVGCSVSTVNGALDGFVVELPSLEVSNDNA